MGNSWRLQSRLSNSKKLVLLELGVGFNTPSVIRWPMERFAHQLPAAHLIRINTEHAEVPQELGERALSIEADAGRALDELVRARPD